VKLPAFSQKVSLNPDLNTVGVNPTEEDNFGDCEQGEELAVQGDEYDDEEDQELAEQQY
jgi:hypothetical protein